MAKKVRSAPQALGIACVATTAWYLMPAATAGAAVVERPGAAFDVPNFLAGPGAPLDIDGDAINDVFLAPAGPAVGFNVLVGDGGISEDVLPPNARLYQPGDLISFTGSFRLTLLRLLSDLSSPQFIGAKFTADALGTPASVLGHFSLAYDLSLDVLHVGGIAYETQTSTDLTVVPEPTSLAAMAVGAIGLLRRRRGGDAASA